MKYDEKLKSLKLYVAHENFISGDGFLEENSVINGRLHGRFHVGAYSLVDVASYCTNTFIGRFSFIDKNCYVGNLLPREELFSNHPFARDLPFIAADDYYKKIKTSRYFYEQNKYTFIGSDVYIGKNSVVNEGVVIGDGAVVYPNSTIIDDVPPYAIVSGNPANIIGYRFDEVTRNKLIVKKWWKLDLSSLFDSPGINLIDFVKNDSFIEELFSAELPNLVLKKFHFDSLRKKIEENHSYRMITGPSHVDLWLKKYNSNDVSKPSHYHLFPIPALSLFSEQLKNLISWWNEWFGEVLLFVPDFRIGNVAVHRDAKDGRFIRQDMVSQDNSEKCYKLGINTLNELSKNAKVKFWFWCLCGREEFNKLNNHYKNADGEYRHPIWNYSDLLEAYPSNTIDIKLHVENILDEIVDGSIHPTNSCYDKLSDIFDRLVV